MASFLGSKSPYAMFYIKKSPEQLEDAAGAAVIGGGGGVHSQSTQSNNASQFNANLQVVSVKEHVSAAGRA